MRKAREREHTACHNKIFHKIVCSNNLLWWVWFNNKRYIKTHCESKRPYYQAQKQAGLPVESKKQSKYVRISILLALPLRWNCETVSHKLIFSLIMGSASFHFILQNVIMVIAENAFATCTFYFGRCDEGTIQDTKTNSITFLQMLIKLLQLRHYYSRFSLISKACRITLAFFSLDCECMR